MNAPSSAYEAAWSAIDREKRRDRTIRRLSIISWSTTFLVLLVFAAIMLARIVLVQQRVEAGLAMPQAAYDAALPLVAVFGVFSLLIATLSTVGIFLRLRTASLSEIQLRLASLEDMVRGERRESAPME
jgi:Na+/proline symporter